MNGFYLIAGPAIIGLIVLTIAIGRTTAWRGLTDWKPPHRRHVQDYQNGDEELSEAERQALAELETLHLHRKHPYC